MQFGLIMRQRRPMGDSGAFDIERLFRLVRLTNDVRALERTSKIDGAVIEQRNRLIPERGCEDDSDELDRRERIEGCRDKMLQLQWSLNNVVC
ncbi:hypothetical protein TNIN_25721 [Trichonephila inaurata madagascariensis]|uniref:Uncharacterized protein n=1 Tax=Trichonephila inaurata madagascariensis TaxID=2747483 RepID=A0A8X6WQM7_9ARAC|nr:hypothetical protein TNIN_25721 [Trichonephila inaurata madagascariensis]